jgi:hypothetical protein
VQVAPTLRLDAPLTVPVAIAVRAAADAAPGPSLTTSLVACAAGGDCGSQTAPVTACEPSLSCRSGDTLLACAGSGGSCWYALGDRRFDCATGCRCDVAWAAATSACR